MGYIEAICMSERKGTPKNAVPSAELRENWGMVNDAHAGDWHRQVSLLAGESIDLVKTVMAHLKQGAFAENIITRGVDLKRIQVGDKLRLSGQVILEVTQIGKECHTACAIRKITGDCIMPKEGIFTRVLNGGKIQPFDSIEAVEKEEAVEKWDYGTYRTHRTHK